MLRTAFGLWQELDAPYDMAHVRLAIARACRALGDNETAELEMAAARRVFEALGAAPALADVDGGAAAPATVSVRASSRCCTTSPADGPIARSPTQLGISERTVDRHVSNLYTKLDVSTRAAATAWAYEHDLA